MEACGKEWYWKSLLWCEGQRVFTYDSNFNILFGQAVSPCFHATWNEIHKDTTFNLNSQSILFFSAAQEQNLQLTENFTIKALKQRIVYLPGLPALMGKQENATPFFLARKRGLSCGSGGATHWHHRCATRIDACRTNWRLWDLGADSFWVWENESFCHFAVLRCFVFFKGWLKFILCWFGDFARIEATSFLARWQDLQLPLAASNLHCYVRGKKTVL